MTEVDIKIYGFYSNSIQCDYFTINEPYQIIYKSAWCQKTS